MGDQQDEANCKDDKEIEYTMEYPRVLVISNNSFSLSNSNGRTLGLLFKGWPKDKLAQMCLMTDGPYWEVCDNYFLISDADVVKSFLRLREVPRNDLTISTNEFVGRRSKIKRTALTSIIRHILWQIGLWRGASFNEWLESVSPDIVIIQSGDTAFTHNLARKIANQFNAKLVFFNTEGIFFLKNNFLYKGFADGLLFPVYRLIYRNAYSKAMKRASFAIYLHDRIQEDNDSCFSVPSKVIYNSTSLVTSNKVFNEDSLVISFFGNFSYGRAKTLVEVGNILQSINSSFKINVYGNARGEDYHILMNAPGINYKGFIPYSEIQKEIENSDILLHVESQDPYFEENLKYGFSTKIADSLASGRSFLVYSSPKIACYNYLKENNCAWVSSDKTSLKSAIKGIISDKEKREQVISRALNIAAKNHDVEKNKKMFQDCLLSLTNKSSRE